MESVSVKSKNQPFSPADIQGVRGIGARFLKLSHASAVSPILTIFSQYTPLSIYYLVPLPGKIKGPSTGESHCRMREDGE
jgi:hypothetical protein